MDATHTTFVFQVGGSANDIEFEINEMGRYDLKGRTWAARASEPRAFLKRVWVNLHIEY